MESAMSEQNEAALAASELEDRKRAHKQLCIQELQKIAASFGFHESDFFEEDDKKIGN